MNEPDSISDFIHSLPIPSVIVSFEGEIKDVNLLGVKELNAHSKLEVMKYSVLDLMIDKSKFLQRVDLLQEENVLQNKKVLAKTIDGRIFERTMNASILSREKGLYLSQYCGSVELQHPTFNRSQVILSEIRKLLPYLNKTGQELLNQIHNTHYCQLEKNIQEARIKLFSQQLVDQFPELTCAEMYLCSLILMGFSSREIAHFNGFTPNSIRVNIYRLCRKYNVDSRDELFLLLKTTINNYQQNTEYTTVPVSR